MITHAGRRPGGCWCTAGVAVVGVALLAAGGCGRAFYRRQADRQVYTLVDRAADDPRWPLEGFTIEPDPQSRMFDPFRPDYPPMPPDDPTAHRLMHCVDRQRGSPRWRRYGQTGRVDNPNWEAYLPQDDRGQLVLGRAGAVEMALLHSPEYQRELEELYLSALDVTFERFRLDTQFFGGNATSFEAEGPLAGGRSLLTTDTDLQMQRLLAAGGELVVGMANSLVWQFAGPDTYRANTLLDFSLVQPLLRAGGRAVVLERLTAAERALLANIRFLERFRREFYTRVVIDYLALLEEQIRIRNQERNVAALQDSYERLEEAFAAGQMKGQTRYQVDLALQSLLNGQSTLLSLNAAYEDRLDAYKITLGLPPDLDVRIEDPLLERFNLIAPALSATQSAVAVLLRAFRDPDTPMPADYRERLTTIREESAAHLSTIQRDFQLLLDALPARTRHLRQLSARPEVQRGDVDPRVCDVDGLHRRVVDLCREWKGIEAARQLAKQLERELPELEEGEDPRGLAEKLRETLDETERFSELAPMPGADAAALRRQLVEWLSTMSDQLLQLSLIQAGARLDAVTLVPVQLAPEKGLRIARENRRDWMNARAALVDTWRQIEVAANDLQSGLDVTFSGDIDTLGNNPVRFRSTTGHLRVGLEFDAPLTRLAERNVYRQALIAYQQARREYYTFEDEINRSLRSRLRTMRLDQLDFEVSRAAVFVAITRVDLARLALGRPPRPGETSQLGATAARDLVEGLRALLAAQNTFLRLWVAYEIERLSLDLDLGTMRLDGRGIWVDPGPIEQGAPAPVKPPEPMPAPAGAPAEPDRA